MAIDIGCFNRNVTLSEYAQKADTNNDKSLDDNELTSLFKNLENDEAKYMVRINDNKKSSISNSIITGLLTAGGLSLFSEKNRNWKSFGLTGIAFGFGSYVGQALYNQYRNCQLEDIKLAKEEYKRIMSFGDI